MLCIQIKTDNAAFEYSPGIEVARILRQAALLLKDQDDFKTKGKIFNLRDVNGNTVGYVSIR